MYQTQTDQIKKVQLTSTLEQVLWSRSRAALGGRIGLEILTHFVGDGSKIEIEISDENGKTFGKYSEKISGNRFWAQIQVPANAKQALYASAKLSKHGLQLKSDPLILLPAIEITNAKWDKKEARRGDILKLSADVKGVPDGTEGLIEIWEHDSDGAHDLITKFPVTVKDKKVEAEWEYEYHEDTDEIPSDAELQNSGRSYSPPEYFFRLTIGEVSADSGMLEFKDWVRVFLIDECGAPIPSEEYLLVLADGTEKHGQLDSKGMAEIKDVPPGSFRLEFPKNSAPHAVKRPNP